MGKKIIFGTILLVLIFAFGISVYNFTDYIKKKNEPTRIFEISKTEVKFQHKFDDLAKIEKNYMIINPPKDLSQLKVLVEKHHNENSIDNALDIYNKKHKYYSVFYYRESSKLPRTWQPQGGFWTADYIDKHKSDCIASIFWSNQEDKKRFYVMEKDSSRSNYGKAIREENFYIDIPTKKSK